MHLPSNTRYFVYFKIKRKTFPYKKCFKKKKKNDLLEFVDPLHQPVPANSII